jgi:putative membrane protein
MTLSNASLALDNAREAPAAMRLASDDRAFINQTAAAGKYEVEASRLAESKGKSPEIKRFAGMLVKDHTASNAELKALARDKSFDLNDEMSKKQTSELEALKQKTGADFDAAFVSTIGIEAHKTNIQKFGSASRTSRDDDLKKWASKTLPTLERHLAQAESLRP